MSFKLKQNNPANMVKIEAMRIVLGVYEKLMDNAKQNKEELIKSIEDNQRTLNSLKESKKSLLNNKLNTQKNLNEINEIEETIKAQVEDLPIMSDLIEGFCIEIEKIVTCFMSERIDKLNQIDFLEGLIQQSRRTCKEIETMIESLNKMRNRKIIKIFDFFFQTGRKEEEKCIEKTLSIGLSILENEKSNIIKNQEQIRKLEESM